MYLIFPIIVSVALTGVHQWTHMAYSHVFEKKKSQIAADNALFRVGNLDRALFKSVRASNNTLKKMHRSHHALHACARMPATAVKCAGPDKAIEHAIHVYVQTQSARLKTAWVLHGRAMQQEWKKLGYAAGKVDRSLGFPSIKVTCHICGLTGGWEVRWNQAGTQVRVGDGALARLEWHPPEYANYRWVQ
jgi:hypothetical protein